MANPNPTSLSTAAHTAGRPSYEVKCSTGTQIGSMALARCMSMMIKIAKTLSFDGDNHMTRRQAGSHQRRLAAAHRHHGPATSATKNDHFLLYQPHGQLAGCAWTAHQRLLAPTSSPRLWWAPLRHRHAGSPKRSKRQRDGGLAVESASRAGPVAAAMAAEAVCFILSSSTAAHQHCAPVCADRGSAKGRCGGL